MVKNMSKTAFENTSTDFCDLIMSNTIVFNDLQPIFKILMDKLELYVLISMKNLTFDFESRFLSFFNFVIL